MCLLSTNLNKVLHQFWLVQTPNLADFGLSWDSFRESQLKQNLSWDKNLWFEQNLSWDLAKTWDLLWIRSQTLAEKEIVFSVLFQKAKLEHGDEFHLVYKKDETHLSKCQ